VGKIKLHHVYHTGANILYFLHVLDALGEEVELTKEGLYDFSLNGIPEGTDVLTYQTFPDQYNKKFNKNLVEKTDKIFKSFEGLKILVCSHDCGDIDSFERFPDSKTLPRVKCFPTKWFIDNYNVILLSTVSSFEKIYEDKLDRETIISCNFGEKQDNFYHHMIREKVTDYLDDSFLNFVEYGWVKGKENYVKSLRKVRIVIGAPGWGRYNGSYSGALRAGALLFAHRSLNDIQFLPHDKLIDGEDYVSYDLFNFRIKLQRLLDSPKEIDRIRKNGRRKWKKGFDINKSAKQFLNYLKGEVK